MDKCMGSNRALVCVMLLAIVLATATLAADRAYAADTYEPNGSYALSYGPCMPGSYTSYAYSDSDQDYFRLEVLRPSHLSVQLTVPAGLELEIRLFEDGSSFYGPLAEARSWSDGEDVTLTYTFQEPGRYHLAVYGIWATSSTTNPYRLDIACAGLSKVSRESGADRVATSVAVSERAFPFGSGRAVLATAYNYPDALAGAVLAYALDAPLLLTDPKTLSWQVADEIRRLGVRDIYLLGGTGALSSDIEDEVADEDTLAHRIAGKDRYDTARLIAAQVKSVRGLPVKAFIATGESFADALSASPYAALKGYPIVLTASSELSPAARTALDSLDVNEVVIVGGVSAVGPRVEAAIKGMGITTTRIAGEDRTATSVAMARVAVADGMTMSRPLIATGINFPDALAGGVLGAKLRSPMLLTNPVWLSTHTRAMLVDNAASTSEIILLGGSGALSDGVASEIDAVF